MMDSVMSLVLVGVYGSGVALKIVLFDVLPEFVALCRQEEGQR